MTNAERIKNMSNEELSEFMNQIGEGDSLCHYMGKEFINSCANPNVDACEICIMKWLESEAS